MNKSQTAFLKLNIEYELLKVKRNRELNNINKAVSRIKDSISEEMQWRILTDDKDPKLTRINNMIKLIDSTSDPETRQEFAVMDIA